MVIYLSVKAFVPNRLCGLKKYRIGLPGIVSAALAAMVFLSALCFADTSPVRLVLKPGNEIYRLRDYADVFEDMTSGLTIEDVSSPERSSRFVPLAHRKKLQGVRGSPIWLRFTVLIPESSENRNQEWVFYNWHPLIDNMTIHVPVLSSPDGDREWTSSGVSREYFWDRYQDTYVPFALGVRIPSGVPITCYIRLKNRLGSLVDLTVQTRQRFHQAWLRVVKIHYCYLGFLICLLVYGSAMYRLINDKSYLYLACYILTDMVLVLNSRGPSIPLISAFAPDISDTLRRLMMDGGLFFFILLTRQAFRIKGNLPRANACLCAAAACLPVPWIGILLTGFAGFHSLWMTLDIMVQLVIIITGVYAWSKGHKPGRYFMVAYAVAVAGTSAWLMVQSEWIPFNQFNALTLPILFRSLVFLLMMLGLADTVMILKQEKKALMAQERRLSKLSYTDSLTGLFNRRFFESKLKGELEHAERLKTPLSLIVIDVDNFKRFNDRFGHHQGDEVLGILGRVMIECGRETDSACRYGGEEFAVIAPATDIQGGFQLSERIRTEFRKETFEMEPVGKYACTLSAGVALKALGDDSGTLFKRADDLLYEAKNRGRNRTCFPGALPKFV